MFKIVKVKNDKIINKIKTLKLGDFVLIKRFQSFERLILEGERERGRERGRPRKWLEEEIKE